MFEVGINKDYIKLLIDQTYGGEGAEYTGEKDLLEVKLNIVILLLHISLIIAFLIIFC